ncbi:hypothetical protein [Cytobacillus gottheilii]|uniref:hypothetical protein n=1 Tax=Cytobacillus gottheilii TaxID=859144 RepID=UPI0024942B8E|nr:hypothetical protein [Cytobacillus gottheilii]
MKESVKQKYWFNEDDKEDLRLIIKRVIKIVIAIIVIKLLRVYLIRNESTAGLIHTFNAAIPLEVLLKFTSIGMLFIGLVCLIFWYLIRGKEIIKNRLFSILLFIFLIDSIFIYLYPEIPAAVARAVLEVTIQ